jgi:glycerophosphoryl diester phosphodiesterase
MLMKTIFRSLLAAIVVLAAFVYLNNSSLLAEARPGRPVLLAHRGMAQTFSREGLTRDGCTATRIFAPEHAYLENTLASMEAAFRAGADIVEIDIHPTTDGAFAIFHDWTVDCRTEGKGVTREHSLAELKALDVGYGYTADGGKSFPFRGKGIGLMPSLDEVLAAFPDKRFLINIKSDDATEGEALADRLAQLTREQRALIMVYGGNKPIAALHARLPKIPVGSHASMKACIIRYFALGWTGYVPESCRKGIMLVPLNVAPWMWGWPMRYVERMKKANVNVFVAGPYEGGASGGVDDLELLAQLPEDYAGGIWTDRIEHIAPAVRGPAR